MANVVELLEAEKKVLEHRLNAVSQAIRALGGAATRKIGKVARKGKKMSAGTKAKIAKAAKARWAKIKKG
jgi:hypothetical protein